jgi:hypothetical protein
LVERAVDPYLALGIRRGCTPAEAKAAFRAKAWHAHPDRGGDDSDFVRLSAAYNQIIEELVRNPSPSVPEPEAIAPRDRPTGRAERGASGRPVANDRYRKSPDPNWEPDFVIAGERPRGTRPPKPFDPDWSPDIVLLDDDAKDGGESADPAASSRWVPRASISAACEDSLWETARILWRILILVLIAGGLWACWAVLNHGAP